jgi:hypothetical protein
MSPHDRFKPVSLRAFDGRSNLSTEIGISIRRAGTIHGQGIRASGLVSSEAADFPRPCTPCKSGLNLVGESRSQGERKESIRLDVSQRGFSNQNDKKNRDDDTLLKTPNSVGMRWIDDTERHEFVQAGEKVMACGASGDARGYYAV